METVNTGDFLSWAAVRGIALDERYEEPRCLVYVPWRDLSRFWVFPDTPAAWPFFLHGLVGGLEEWTACYVWPRGGLWPGVTAQGINPDEAIRDVVLRAAGVPKAYAGALRFEANELGLLLALAFVYMAFGWCVIDDLFILPDHGRQFIHTDHHEVIHVNFADADQIEPFIAHMAAAGFSLPDEPPDETFRRPGWMDNGGRSPP